MKKGSLRKSLVAVAAITALLLLVPLAAMQFTGEVSWGPADFVAAAALLLGAGTAIVLASRWFDRPAHKRTAIAAITLLTLLAWAELAVGLFD